ncbi:MAG: response regulator [Spirochaetaceae bacterium]|nr:response regulator [Myxococcales bacterium]MCB9726398.1 response regulator [Spirochaetaceae bacterium]HPG24682.1 response regulator [Myxococcota bacterium]
MKSILVVDDSAVARRIAVKCLSSIGVGEKIREARNGQEALDMIREEAPDLILADLNMPVLDGVSMVRKIKANPRLVGIPVIVISSILDDARRRELRERGVDHLVEKPVSPPLLAAAVEEIRERQEAEER